MPIPCTDFDLTVIPQDLNSRDVVFLMAGAEESKEWKTQVFITVEETDQTPLTRVCPRKYNGQRPRQSKNIQADKTILAIGRADYKMHLFLRCRLGFYSSGFQYEILKYSTQSIQFTAD